MRIPSTFFFLILMVAFLFPPSAKAEAPQGGRGIAQRLERLTAQIEAIQKKQEEILNHQNETIEEIKKVKIWAFHG